MDKVKAFVRKNKTVIAVVAGSVVFGVVVGSVVKFAYGLGGVMHVNDLLQEGFLEWTDGMPVIDTSDGKVISGNPNWNGDAKWFKGDRFVDRVV